MQLTGIFCPRIDLCFFTHASWTTLGDNATTPSPHLLGASHILRCSQILRRRQVLRRISQYTKLIAQQLLASTVVKLCSYCDRHVQWSKYVHYATRPSWQNTRPRVKS